MANNYTNRPINLESLNSIRVEKKLLELSKDEVSFIKGGTIFVEGSPPLTDEQEKQYRGKFFPIPDILLRYLELND